MEQTSRCVCRSARPVPLIHSCFFSRLFERREYVLSAKSFVAAARLTADSMMSVSPYHCPRCRHIASGTLAQLTSQAPWTPRAACPCTCLRWAPIAPTWQPGPTSPSPRAKRASTNLRSGLLWEIWPQIRAQMRISSLRMPSCTASRALLLAPCRVRVANQDCLIVHRGTRQLDNAIRHFKLSGDTGDALHNLVLSYQIRMPRVYLTGPHCRRLHIV